jgi:hypothetical protein
MLVSGIAQDVQGSGFQSFAKAAKPTLRRP